MSADTQHRRVLSEWRTIMISQTTYPLVYKIDRPRRAGHGPRWFADDYAHVQIPHGQRIVTKWQEQVRQVHDENSPAKHENPWRIVREWSEAEI